MSLRENWRRCYLGMGSRSYVGHLGFSVMMFVGESPAGPFRPDKERFRLCGSTTRDTNWLAKTLHWRSEILVSNWITTTLDKASPGIFGNGQSLWIGPLKELITDKGGHARLAWWPGNEIAKGAVLPVNTGKAVFAHPAQQHRGTPHSLTPVGNHGLIMKAGRDGAVAMPPERFDTARGIMLEGTLKATEPRGPIVGTHWHAALMRGPQVFTLTAARNPALVGLADWRRVTVAPETARLLPAPPTDGARQPIEASVKAWPVGTQSEGEPPMEIILSDFPAPDGRETYVTLSDPDAAVRDPLLAEPDP